MSNRNNRALSYDKTVTNLAPSKSILRLHNDLINRGRFQSVQMMGDDPLCGILIVNATADGLRQNYVVPPTWLLERFVHLEE